MNNELQTINGPGEVTRVTSAGGGSATFAAKVKSNYLNNIYMVSVVEIIGEGFTPAEVGGQFKAINLAESFTQQGQLAVGRYVLVCASGDKNVFYAEA